MNLLRGFKAKLSTLSDDISANLTKSKPGIDKDHDVAISIGAAEILKLYQNNWSEIHKENVKIFQAAKVTDHYMEIIHDRGMRSYEAFDKLHIELQSMAEFQKTLGSLGERVNNVSQQLSSVESELDALEDTIEWLELCRCKTQRQADLKLHHLRRQEAVNQHQVQLAKLHAAKAAKREAEKQAVLLERQVIFEEEFRRDIAFFKTHGQPERKVSTSSSGRLSASIPADTNSAVPEPDVTELLPEEEGELIAGRAALDLFLCDEQQSTGVPGSYHEDGVTAESTGTQGGGDIV